MDEKKRHELDAARAGRPVTQTTPGEKGLTSSPITGISTPYYRFHRMQIQKSKLFVDFVFSLRVTSIDELRAADSDAGLDV